MLKLTKREAHSIANEISPIFQEYVNQYDYRKYPADDYARFKHSYNITKNDDIHNSLVWKWGHVGKSNFPASHKALIRRIQNLWPSFTASTNKKSAHTTFTWWRNKNVAYITAAFITHLVHHTKKVPIIDQHNFRSINYWIKSVRPNHAHTATPRSWNNIVDLMHFTKVVLAHLPEANLTQFDHFLMMHGRSIKPRK